MRQTKGKVTPAQTFGNTQRDLHEIYIRDPLSKLRTWVCQLETSSKLSITFKVLKFTKIGIEMA